MNLFPHKSKNYKELKMATKSIGRIVENEDTIFCYVSKKAVHALIKDGYLKLNLNTKAHKPIHYIFDSLSLPSIYISTSEFLHFRNCNIGPIINVQALGGISFENCGFNNLKRLACTASSLAFTNCACVNHHNYNTYDIDINVDSFYVFNTKFLYLIDHIKIKTMVAEFLNASFQANDIYLKADQIKSINGYMHADEIIIDNYNNDFDPQTLAIKTHFFTYNRIREGLDGRDSMIELAKKRKELVFLLKKIKSKSNRIIHEEVKTYKNELENEPINRLIRKKDQD